MKLAPLLLFALCACHPVDAATDGPGQGRALADAGTPPRPRGSYEVGALRVIDGDTFEMNGETIRIANIDTPETGSRSRCLAEAQLGAVATRELTSLFGMDYADNGHTILPTIHRAGRDRYGRTLATVELAQGGDVGEALISRGMAARWAGRRADWCGVSVPGQGQNDY